MRGYDDDELDDDPGDGTLGASWSFANPERAATIDADPYEPCVHCGGSGLSPYPGDGGSCPHCILGRVRRSENAW